MTSRMLASLAIAVCGVIAILSLAAGPSMAQIALPTAAPPTAPTVAPVMVHLRNAQVLPADISEDQLRGTMRTFTQALGVRCAFCHADGEAVPFANRDWASDANPKKNIARGMMRLIARLNTTDLPGIGLTGARVTCYSCHGGATKPAVAPVPAAPIVAPAVAPTPGH